MDILSQGDNWFIFHLLSSIDLTNVQRANAHFSEDILSVLLNEPIPGQGVFWSSVSGTAYPVPLRVLSFEHLFSALDPTYSRPAVKTFAQIVKAKFQTALEERLDYHSQAALTSEVEVPAEARAGVEPVDALAVYRNRAIETLRNNHDLMEQIH